ncbi:MAG TPA: DnaA/Hda family protein, partial [Gemmatimonadaceae bacterium]|nr:DnaA/Hda family protein [Gemmatimonadaceae bacterium]
LDGRQRFENYVVGSGNRLAVAAARAVAESPGAAYNPLFIYSGSGLGKTHLLLAIGHHARHLEPDLSVEYATLDDFFDRMHAAVAAGQGDAFKQRYQHVDLLLLDDVQFLTGRRETQSELLRLFNALQGSGRQIVMTSDRPPAEIADVDERLVNRMAGGLVVDVGPPDYETRVAILRSKCEDRRIVFGPGVLEELARYDFANVRELQGALNRLAAQQSLGAGELTPEGVRALFGDQHPAPPTPAGGAGGTPRMAFDSFISEIAVAVAQHVEPWKQRLAEAIEYWTAEGYRVSVLERALQLSKAPDVEGLLGTFSAAVDRLKELEGQANAIDGALGGAELFRDPERVAEAEELVQQAMVGKLPPPAPSGAFQRSGFETGSSNQLAVRAADAVVESPGRAYNPLFLHGPSGVGKTHLLNAIGNELIEVSGGAMRVACVGAQQFVDELIAALQEGSVEQWRTRYRLADALIIDDVHFIAGKERTQEELFYVFNAMHSSGRQIVLSSDRPPKELGELEERLRSRFEGGLVVEIQRPDRALRERLYARHLSVTTTPPEPDLISYLADRPAESAREIAGIVHRLSAAADMAGEEITLRLARSTLEGAGTAPAPAPKPPPAPPPPAPAAAAAAASAAAASAGTPSRGTGSFVRITGSIRAVEGADPETGRLDAFFFDNEKVVWDWPDVSGRVIEEIK